MLPLSFYDIDQALAEAAQANLSHKRGKKRQNATITRLNPNLKGTASEAGCKQTSRGRNDGSDMRIGRWTTEETAYCDLLIEHFSNGVLPIPNDIKLHDFLANLLKSKPSRLTKKMKNARLSSQQYSRKRGGMLTVDEARELSQLETAFFASMKCNMERSEIRFHMQRVWRELFVSFCSDIGQPLNVIDWEQSIKEMDRRNSSNNSWTEVTRATSPSSASSHDAMQVTEVSCSTVGDLSTVTSLDNNRDITTEACSMSDYIVKSFSAKRPRFGTPSKDMAAAFSSATYTDMVIHHIQNHGFPFEHVDVWVPSNTTDPMKISSVGHDDNIRLHFAGCSTADTKIPPGGSQSIPMSAQEKFSMVSFGVYSQKFISFVGKGLPGRIFSTGIPSWDQGIQSTSEFERIGGARQFGIETVVGLPIACPSVGRLVLLFYSMYDRPRDDCMLNRLVEELAGILPAPRWSLTVEVGAATHLQTSKTVASRNDPRMVELLKLIDENMPTDQHAPLVQCLPGLTLLRLLILKPWRSNEEAECLDVALNTFEAYKLEGRPVTEIVGLTSRAFVTMTCQQNAGLMLDSKSCNSPSFAHDQRQSACCDNGQSKPPCCSQTCNRPNKNAAPDQVLTDEEDHPYQMTLLPNANSAHTASKVRHFHSDASCDQMAIHSTEQLSPPCQNIRESCASARVFGTPPCGLVQDDNGTLDASLLQDFLTSNLSHGELESDLLHDFLASDISPGELERDMHDGFSRVY